jgi:(2Fe-2S) ferredoxin
VPSTAPVLSVKPAGYFRLPSPDQPFERHVFVCTRGEWCPLVDGDGLGVHARLKSLVKQAGLAELVRVNHAGCFSQCGHGPMIVVYPDAVWYSGVSTADCEQIFRDHLVGGQPVERLRYRPGAPGGNKLPRDDQGRAIGRRPDRQA